MRGAWVGVGLLLRSRPEAWDEGPIVPATGRCRVKGLNGMDDGADLDFTLRKIRSQPMSDNPIYLAQRQRFVDGLREAGLPEY